MDDIIVMSNTFEEHLKRLGLVFDRLRTTGLKLKPSKCFLFQEKVKFLGSIVSSAGIEPDPDKVRAVSEWPVPKTLSELRAFVALASYYRRHVKGFAEIARPLHDLTKKGQPFVRSRERQSAFKRLKAGLVSYPILATPIQDGTYVVGTDASDKALGAVLQQHQDGILRVISLFQPSSGSGGTKLLHHKKRVVWDYVWSENISTLFVGSAVFVANRSCSK